jgi:hypothetical protein
MKKYFFILLISLISLISCDDASVASQNLSKAADMFEINRRVVFYNGITDKYILVIEGRCSVEFFSDKFTVTVKIGPDKFMKHYLGRADNVFPFVEQLDTKNVSTYHYRVIFKPSTIIPNIDLK